MENEIANEINILNNNSLASVRGGIMNGYIPNWLLVELLIRLPPKVVFRFKLVSKQWLSIILDPCFVKTYCSRANSLQKLHLWTFIACYSHFCYCYGSYIPDGEVLEDIYSSNLKWSNLNVRSLPWFPQSNEKGYKIYEVSNGLVLYSPYQIRDIGYPEADYRICNPVTGQWISLYLDNNQQYECDSWGFMTNIEDGVLLSYTVVRLFVYNKFLATEVFISEVGYWKKYYVPIDIAMELFFKSSSAIVNGVMHWMLPEDGLIAYDPHKHPERIRVIALPGEPIVGRFYHICAEYGGTLRYFRVCGSMSDFYFRSFSIWVLNDYSSDNWCLQHRVSYSDIQISGLLARFNLLLLLPMGFDPNDPDVVYLGFHYPFDLYNVAENFILSYNIRTKKLEVSEDFRPYGYRKIASWKFAYLLVVHLLVVPPWPISLSPSSIIASED